MKGDAEELADLTARMELGKRLRRAREARGLSQERSAMMLGTRQCRLSEYERGVKTPSFLAVARMVSVLGLDPKIVSPEFFRNS